MSVRRKRVKWQAEKMTALVEDPDGIPNVAAAWIYNHQWWWNINGGRSKKAPTLRDAMLRAEAAARKRQR